MTENSISFIVCSNGYGHIERVSRVINELLNLRTTLVLNLFAGTQQINFAKSQGYFRDFDNVSFDSSLSEFEVLWTDGGRFSKNNYFEWWKELYSNEVLQKSHLIVSDNYVLPSRIFDNVLLMGSFLWHDSTISMNSDQKEIAKEEKRFLTRNKPSLLCLGDMVMEDTLYNQVKLEKLPWFAESVSTSNNGTNQNGILVTGGGTGIMTSFLMEIAVNLKNKKPELDIYLDKKIFESEESARFRDLFRQFDFTADSFSNLKAVICRPGIGILTDCVSHRIPIFAINDNFNKEINHNSNRIIELEIGLSYKIKDYKVWEIVDSILATINDDIEIQNFKNALNKRQMGGAKATANFILRKLDGEY